MSLEHDLFVGAENDTPAEPAGPRAREFFWIAICLALVPLVPDAEPEVTARHVQAATESKTDLRPCDGLFVRHSEARFRGAVQCAPSADLTERRPLPSHILTMPLAEKQ